MRFHVIMPVRDEADIIAQTLDHLLTWADAVHILDTGSTDGTWDRVQEAAARDRRIKPLWTRPVVFDNNIRGVVFEEVRSTFEHGDWVARWDADEFAHVPPPRWIAENLRGREARVFAQMYEFLVTRRELEAWDHGHGVGPIEGRRRHYLIEPVIELRLFRYRARMKWNWAMAQPHNVGLTSPARLPIRHYRWRTPAQIQHRCRLRAVMGRLSYHGVHWDRDQWKEWIADDADPRLRYWTPETELPLVRDLGHLSPLPTRVVQSLLYTSPLVPLLDRLRPSRRPFHIEPLADHLQDSLRWGFGEGEKSPVST